MITEDDYLDGLNDIAEILDNLNDDELWDRYMFTVNALANHFNLELEVVSING